MADDARQNMTPDARRALAEISRRVRNSERGPQVHYEAVFSEYGIQDEETKQQIRSAFGRAGGRARRKGTSANPKKRAKRKSRHLSPEEELQELAGLEKENRLAHEVQERLAANLHFSGDPEEEVDVPER